MKKIAYVFAALLLLCAIVFAFGRFEAMPTEIDVIRVPVALAAPKPREISIVAYNIAHSRGPIKGTSNWSEDKAARLARSQAVGRHLASIEADIVILNEVDFDAAWSGNIDHAVVVARAGGYPFVAKQTNFAVRLPGFSLEFGNAILSRYPIKSAERIPLPPLHSLEAIFFGNHDVIRSTISTGDLGDIDVWGIHLEVRDTETRIGAIAKIAERLSISRPFILAGDFNSQLPDNESRATALGELLSDRYSDFPIVACETGATFPTLAPTRRLDWIVYSSELTASQCGLSNANLSDHLPVTASFSKSEVGKAGDIATEP